MESEFFLNKKVNIDTVSQKYDISHLYLQYMRRIQTQQKGKLSHTTFLVRDRKFKIRIISKDDIN